MRWTPRSLNPFAERIVDALKIFGVEIDLDAETLNMVLPNR